MTANVLFLTVRVHGTQSYESCNHHQKNNLCVYFFFEILFYYFFFFFPFFSSAGASLYFRIFSNITSSAVEKSTCLALFNKGLKSLMHLSLCFLSLMKSFIPFLIVPIEQIVFSDSNRFTMCVSGRNHCNNPRKVGSREWSYFLKFNSRPFFGDKSDAYFDFTPMTAENQSTKRFSWEYVAIPYKYSFSFFL